MPATGARADRCGSAEACWGERPWRVNARGERNVDSAAGRRLSSTRRTPSLRSLGPARGALPHVRDRRLCVDCRLNQRRCYAPTCPTQRRLDHRRREGRLCASTADLDLTTPRHRVRRDRLDGSRRSFAGRRALSGSCRSTGTGSCCPSVVPRAGGSVAHRPRSSPQSKVCQRGVMPHPRAATASTRSRLRSRT